MLSKPRSFLPFYSLSKTLTKSPFPRQPTLKNFYSNFVNPMSPKFFFDSEGKTRIFIHKNGENDLRWLVRGLVLFTMLNTFLMVSEYVKPIFGGWNGLSFMVTSCLGIGLLIGINIVSKRVIKEIRLLRTGDYVELYFFNAFWVPQKRMFHVSEFANLEISYLMYSRTEITSLGNAWINLEKNMYWGDSDYQAVLDDVLNGRVIKLNRLEMKAKKYQKYH